MAKHHCLVLLCCLVGLPTNTVAHDKAPHGDQPAQVPKSVAPSAAPRSAEPAHVPIPDSSQAHTKSEIDTAHAPVPAPEPRQVPDTTGKQMNTGTILSIETVIRDLSFSEFPTLHPLVVHVPVTFIPLAFLFALISLFVMQRAFVWLAFAFTLGGLGGGLVAAFPMHPHTAGLSTAASATLQKHDFFAYGTLWLALVAVFVALVCLWKPARLSKLCLILVLMLAGGSVSITGHYGGTLAYVHGIGVQGQYLSSH